MLRSEGDDGGRLSLRRHLFAKRGFKQMHCEGWSLSLVYFTFSLRMAPMLGSGSCNTNGQSSVDCAWSRHRLQAEAASDGSVKEDDEESMQVSDEGRAFPGSGSGDFGRRHYGRVGHELYPVFMILTVLLF